MENEKIYEFTFLLEGPESITSALEDAIYEAGCDDALLYQKNGIIHLEFNREATSLEKAVISAIEDVASITMPIQIKRIEPGDIVTASEIGRRLGFSREYIRLLINGERGEGKFPYPIAKVSSKSFLWSWRDVSHFAFLYLPDSEKYAPEYKAAKLFHRLNMRLQEREESSVKEPAESYEDTLKKVDKLLST